MDLESGSERIGPAVGQEGVFGLNTNPGIKRPWEHRGAEGMASRAVGKDRWLERELVQLVIAQVILASDLGGR